MSHTPGPWYATASAVEGSVFAAESHEVIVPWSPLQSDRRMANARLIAAAPEMLAFIHDLQQGRNDYDLPDGIVCLARALLARIEDQES